MFDSLPLWARNCLFSDKKDPIFDSEPLNEELKERLSSGERISTFDGAVENFLRAKRAGGKWCVQFILCIVGDWPLILTVFQVYKKVPI